MRSVPNANFTYSVKIPAYSDIMSSIGKFYKQNHFLYNGSMYIDPPNGLLTLKELNLTIWVENLSRSGYHTFWFDTESDWLLLKNDLKIRNDNVIKKINHKLYRFTDRGWFINNQYQDTSSFKLIGYNNILSKIKNDIIMHTKHRDFLTSISESKSINYLLHGPPGTGKTSLIKKMTSVLDLPLFVINILEISMADCRNILYPKVVGEEKSMKILLFEDFDRFLQSNEKHIDALIPQILNSLDGIDDNSNIIRIFTGNNIDIIKNVPALYNRMSAKFEFFNPTVDMFEEKFKIFLSFYPPEKLPTDEKIKEFLSILPENITLRPFSNYVIRYLFDDNYMQKLIDNIKELC